MSDRWEHFNKYGHHFFGEGECSVCVPTRIVTPPPYGIGELSYDFFADGTGGPIKIVEPKTWAKLIGIKGV